MIEETEDLALLHPIIRPYVKVLLSHEFGLLKELPKIYGINCGSLIVKNQRQYGDRFHIKIMYCRKPLNWQVLWNGFDISQAPDFIMEENYSAYANVDINKLPSLINWSPHNINCLLNVILELLQIYKTYQDESMEGADLNNPKTFSNNKLLNNNCKILKYLKKKCSIFLLIQICLTSYIHLLGLTPNLQRYSFEYDILLHMESLQADDIEVCVCSANRIPLVVFLIRLNVNFSKLPFALPNCKDLAILMIEFKDNAKNTIELISRIELEDALGASLDMPELPPDLSLTDYVPQIEQLLLKKVEKVTHQMYQRKMLYLYLVQLLEPALINGDNITFKHISFLLELNNFFCVLNIHIPESYPENKPTLQFFSLQKTTNCRVSDYNDFFYNQEMTEEDVARSIFNYIKTTAIAEFRRNIT